jgi:FAD/FMN-containing dehydrogenase
MNTQPQLTNDVFDQLTAILSSEGLLTDTYSCSLYAQDVFTKQLPALAVARPDSTEQLSAALRLAHQHGLTVTPRGGGISYTSGYVPAKADTLIIDLGRMNRVVEINRDDMYVTVECGCTWKQLHEALKGSGLRTPYWGTLSGSKATIGGGLSQNSIFWGSGQFGSAADTVISLEVVLADGRILNTGSNAQINSTPFFRHYGPDLTGLFTCDTGAFGFKAKATLKLMPELPAKGYLAFDFKTAEDSIAAMSDIARSGLAMECFGFDPYLQSQRLKRESLSKDVKALAGVMKSSGSLLGAIKDGAKVAMAGRSYMKDVDYSVQVIVEDLIEAGVEHRLQALRKIATNHNGREIENSIPKITRANPFGPVNSMLGPTGERWVPSHGLFPHTKAQQAYETTEAVFAKHRASLDKYEIGTGHLFALIASSCFVLEPVFFWPDAYTEIHELSVEDEHLAKLNRYEENLEARQVVADIRSELAELYKQLGAVHLQIGKAYQYKQGLQPEAFDIIKAIKSVLDPDGRVNPQSLGLE